MTDEDGNPCTLATKVGLAVIVSRLTVLQWVVARDSVNGGLPGAAAQSMGTRGAAAWVGI